MLTPKKKITKKEIRHDKLIENYFKLKAFYLDYQKYIWGALAGLVVIIALIFFYSSSRKSNEEQATTELSKIFKTYDNGAYQQAIDGFPEKKILGLKAIVEKYSSSEAGETAKIYLANCYLNLGKVDEALKYFDDYSGSNELLKISAYTGLATCYEIKGNLSESASYYVKASSVIKDEILTPQNLLNAARIYSQMNEKERARKLLEQIKKDFPESQQARDYERYLAELTS